MASSCYPGALGDRALGNDRKKIGGFFEHAAQMESNKESADAVLNEYEWLVVTAPFFDPVRSL